ncbi:MAG TPA: ATP-dependent helicase HrpB [Thermodesulfobacteriota bacterium]|nr:ATP-dependent helicase HrpB [Thermodesulfobacteriota bacterium]
MTRVLQLGFNDNMMKVLEGKSYPIDEILPRIKETVLASPSAVLQAPPGSGKTTRTPLALLEVISPEKGRILMLEPRRIAAVSAARWIAKTLGEETGGTMGYSIRFESRVSKKTRIEVVTEGILTRRIQTDPGLEGVAMVIFDEFHERSLQADLALALCLDIRHTLRKELKILVMSATLDYGPIASLLDGAPVITSAGKAFPVEERYRPEEPDRPLHERITRAVLTALRETSGDILVFLPGGGEIRVCCESLRATPEGKAGSISIHPLYGDLPFEEQERAILPSGKRKIVLATNIAETSLTIEGVNVVIDSGLTRRLQHDPATGMNRLVTVAVSKAAAAQRKGRAGRLGSGVCYRLYSRHAFQGMIPFTPPEMLSTDLSPLVLELSVRGVKDPAELSWLDPPPKAAWESGRRLLMDLGALDPKGSVTLVGQAMARLPLHPRLGRLSQRAAELGCPRLGADLAAILSERDILRGEASRFMTHGEGDDLGGRVDLLRRWRKQKEAPRGIDPWALQAVNRASQQLLSLMAGDSKACREEQGTTIPRLLLRAFPDRIAKRREEGNGRFILCQGRGVRLPSTSRLTKSPFIIAAHVDAGEKAEGMVHLAEPVDEDLLREELSESIESIRRVEWDKREGRITAILQEKLGALQLSARPFAPKEEEVAPLLCEAVRSGSARIVFSKEARQFQGRVSLMRRTFPEENWPDLSETRLLSVPEEWLMPWLKGIRTREQLATLDLLPPLRARLSWEQQRLLNERAPTSLLVPSGHRATLDYASGDIPILAVKLQEMFGLADTPKIAGGRVKLLLHLLSPARKPAQVTQDLKGFWNSVYQQVKKELKGRYPKHPWPDNPWKAAPTRQAKPRKR